MSSRNATTSLLRHAALAVSTIVLLSLLTLTAIAKYLTDRVSRPRRSRRPSHYTFTPWEFGIEYRQLQIPVGREFISLWHLPRDDPAAPCILAFSGFASHKAELLGITSNLHRDGFQIVLVDFRGTGRSPGDTVTMGHNETEDARAALDWTARTLPNAPIGVMGYSMGGSVALMLAATDKRVDAVVSDSAFARQRDILAYHVHRRTGVWPDPILSIAAPMLRRRHGKTFDDFAPAARAHQISPRPLLLIHARDDMVVPFQHALGIWEQAQEPKEAWFLEEAGHCGAYFQDRPGYCRRISKFFRDSLVQRGEIK